MQVTYDEHRKFLERLSARAQAELLGFCHARLRDNPSYELTDEDTKPHYDRGYSDGKSMILVEEVERAQ